LIVDKKMSKRLYRVNFRYYWKCAW